MLDYDHVQGTVLFGFCRQQLDFFLGEGASAVSDEGYEGWCAAGEGDWSESARCWAAYVGEGGNGWAAEGGNDGLQRWEVGCQGVHFDAVLVDEKL